MRLTPDNIDIWIINYRRTEEVVGAVDSWLASFPFDYINIIDNYGGRKVEDFSESSRDKIRIFHNCMRPQWLTGSMPQCINAAYIHTFDTKDWVLCCHDDSRATPGWPDIINNTPYDIYLAPFGGCTHLTHFNAFKKIGFWNELFRLVGGPEEELKTRCMTHIPNESSIADEHPWLLYHNDVGLEQYWHNMSQNTEILETRKEFGELADSECYQRYIDIYGKSMFDILTPRDFGSPPLIKYINWYPSATKRWKETGRILPNEYFIYDDKELSF